MRMRFPVLTAALAAGITALSAVGASADAPVVNVYKDGYLPNILYLSGSDEITFTNKSGRWVFLDYTSNTTMIPWLAPGASTTVSASLMNSRTLRSPYTWQYGYSTSSSTLITKAGEPPLQ